MNPAAQNQPSLCPSAQPEWKDSVVIGIVGGTVDTPRVAYLDKPLPVNKELMYLADPVHPTEIFRIAAPCMCKGCVHFEVDKCHLVERVIEVLPEVTDDLPPCEIRQHCRWWQQEGKAACMRCPQVVTNNYNPSHQMMLGASPPLP